MDGIKESSGRGGVKFFLLVLPVCLVVSIIGAIWFHWHLETKEIADPGLAMGGGGIEREEVVDLAKKFGWLNSEGWETEEGRKGMHQRIAFIDGTLSPQNYGFVVKRGADVSYEDELWPMVWVDVEGGERKDELVLVTAPYDFGDDNVISIVTAAKELKASKLGRTVRFLVYPTWLLLELGHERRGDFMESGEELVAVLGLRQMGEPVADGGTMLYLNGPSLGALEEQIPKVGIERRLSAEQRRDEFNFNQRMFGHAGAGRYQTIRPVGSATWPKYKEADLDALIARTRVLVELVLALAEEE